jgi:hypothetical protein
MNDRKKKLKEEYRQIHTPMGIYQIRCLANGKLLLGAALNLPGILNSNRFQLKLGKHPNRVLQTDWNQFGSESFSFEILDELAATEGVDFDYRQDLASLEALWLEKLQPYDDRGYNKKREHNGKIS